MRVLLEAAHDITPAWEAQLGGRADAAAVSGMLAVETSGFLCKLLVSEAAMTSAALRSRNWFGRNDLDGFVHRSWLKAEGFSDVVFDGRPVIGIANS